MIQFKTNTKADETRVKACLDYIRDNPEYSFDKFLNEYNLLEGAQTQGENVLITCPFHEDWSPSMSINLEKKIYKCFSCSRGGGYIKFVTDYNNEVLGNNLNFYTLLEKFLKEDMAMRLTLGFSSLYQEVSKETLGVNFKRFKPTLTTQPQIPKTFMQLATKMKADKNIKHSDIILMITLMQSELSVVDVYKEIYENNKNKEEITFDINDILNS